MGVVGERFFGRSFFNHSFFDRSYFDRSRGKGRSVNKLRASAKAVVPLISVFALGACAIRPVQQNVTGLQVVEIVNHIRCETRIAIQLKAIDELRWYSKRKYGNEYSPLADRLEKYLGVPWDLTVVNPIRDLDPTELAFYKKYIQTGIAYNFTFDITEDNKAALMADPVRLITNGTAGIGLSSSGEFSRENSRTFIVSETFLHLLQDGTSVPKSCDVGMLANENFAYPVTGSIGMHEMISTFIDLNQEEALTPSSGSSSTSTKGASATSSKAPATSTSGSGVFADTMNFNTTLMGGVTPSVQINPIGNKWGLSSPTNFAATVTRSDKHMLIVGLSLETSSTRIPLVSTTFLVPMSGSQARSALQKNRPISPAEQRALDAVQQQRLDTFLNRFGTVVP